jgi:hypothetical protein
MVAMKHLKNQAVPLSQIRPDVPRELDEVIERLMAKRVEKRYQAAKDVQRDLAKLARGLEQADGTLALDGPTNPSISLPAGTATLSRSLSRGVDTVTQRLRRTSSGFRLGLAGALLLVVGLIAGAARRERALPDLPLTPKQRLERMVEGIEKTRDQRRRNLAAEQLAEARLAPEGAARERALWEVLVYHPGHPREVIQAGTELFHTAFDQRDLDLAEMVALLLVERENLGLIGMGHLFDAIIQGARDPGSRGMAKARAAFDRFAAVFTEPDNRPANLLMPAGPALSAIRGGLSGREADHSWLIARAHLGWRRCQDSGTTDEAGKASAQQVETALRFALTQLDPQDRRLRGRGPGGPGGGPGGGAGGNGPRADLGNRNGRGDRT